MSEPPSFSGHKVQGCEGQWINVSSLATPAWTCSLCRATVADPEAEELLWEPIPAQEPTPAERAPPIGLWPILLGVLLIVETLIALGSLLLVIQVFVPRFKVF